MKHTLPGGNGKTQWFSNLNSFEQEETKRQIRFKNKHFLGLSDGTWSKRPLYTYPHIMPEGYLQDVFYPPIAQDVLDYCKDNNIAIHSEALNLRSSQIACFNVLFPLRQDSDLAVSALAPLLPGVEHVVGIEFEYTGPDDNGATVWLGEQAGGKRGQNRTSIDAAITWRKSGKKYMTLVEWKYTERGYGSCGGYESDGNKNKNLCRQLQASTYTTDQCYLTQGRNTRRYWEHLAQAGIEIDSLSGIQGCPFRGPFYQLMRQFLLAEYLRQTLPSTDSIDEVYVASVSHRGNYAIHKAPQNMRHLGHKVEETWNAVLVNVPQLRHVYANSIVDAMRASTTGKAQHLVAYLEDRYGL